jgi:hypothetical protein
MQKWCRSNKAHETLTYFRVHAILILNDVAPACGGAHCKNRSSTMGEIFISREVSHSIEHLNNKSEGA